jgi:hypothetical protein
LKMERKENVSVNLTFSFALDIVKYAEELETNRKFVVSNQLLKSGTSIRAMFGKRRTQKANRTLSINSRLPLKKLKRLFTGWKSASFRATRQYHI